MTLRLPLGVQVTFLAELLLRFILRSHRTKKLPYIYLANDLIQKSMIKRKKHKSDDKAIFNDLHEALAPPRITNVLTQLFTMLKESETYLQNEQQLCTSVLKVVSVWKARKVYNEDALVQLQKKLTEIQGKALEEQDLL
jgi:hypothetical protein